MFGFSLVSRIFMIDYRFKVSCRQAGGCGLTGGVARRCNKVGVCVCVCL